jgi:isoquinoline 1-oxidoreductase alpha subunit
MIKLKINEIEHQLDVDENMPLLWVIRDVIGFTGTKYGCGKGLCGACTVLVDDIPIRSCQTPVSSVNNKHIITIEGIEAINKTVQDVWDDLNVAQCGYCQSGQIISTVALLKETISPTDNDINEALSGNICRCGTYKRIKEAVHESARLLNSKTK